MVAQGPRINPNDAMKYDYHIRNEQYGAGTTYRWDYDKYGIRGVGIATFRIKDKMTIKIRDAYYRVTKKDIMDFMNKHTHSRTERKGITLYVVPLQIMEYVKSEKVEKLARPDFDQKKPAPKESDQLTLI